MTEFLIESAITLLEILLDWEGSDWDGEDLVEEKAATLKGSEEHLQGLKTDLELMLNFLSEFSRSRNRQHLISQVRDMANDVGVILDTFIFTKSDELESIRLNNFLTEIESIRSRFREINLQSPVKEAEEDVGIVQKKKSGDNEEEEEEVVVGLEKYVEAVLQIFGLQHIKVAHRGADEEEVVVSGVKEYVERLRQKFVLLEKEKFMSLLICGMGGIGKTTLARQIYNHEVVVERFERRAWAFVSSEFNMEEVLRTLIRQLVDLKEKEEEVMKEMDLENLKNMLHQHLQGKKYFIVLDDVWDDGLRRVVHALPRGGGNLSRLLITGRSSFECMSSVDCAMRMDHLSSAVSWQLFLKTVFICDNKCPRHLEEIGRQIVKKCNGLPLAIKEAGRKLATMIQSKSEWEEFLESYDFNETIASLQLSYHRLSRKQKSCFLHMSFFEEGTTIRVKKSIHIWNTTGMVTRVLGGKKMEYRRVLGGEEMDDNAEMCIDLLSCKCMIMVADGIESKNLCIDGFLHKICITKAKEEIGFEIIRNEEHCQTPLKPRHRAIYCRREKLNYSVNQDKHLLSLFFHGGGSFDTSPSYWESFEQLRILDFEGFGLKSLPENVCSLGRLRYLGLRDNYMQELPHGLGRLKNLEVLDIALNFMIEVPDIIWEMDSLRHLYMSDIMCRTPLKIDSLKYLQTLTYISVNNWAYEDSNLEKMTSLRKLGIEELDENSDVSKLFASLAKLENLECLILRGYRFRSMPPLDDLSNLRGLLTLKLDGRLTRLPKFPSSIESLTLVNSCLDEDPMSVLLMIPFLLSLVLKNTYTGQEMVVWQQRPSERLSMHIKELWHLRHLKLRNNLQNLPSQLYICSCPYLDNIPKEIISTGSWKLEKLRMVTTRKIAKLIRQWHINSKLDLDIQPY